MLHERFNDILDAVRQACLAHYGDRLTSLAVFGSVARGTMRPDSDVDLLVVVNSLPWGRLARVRDFEAVEAAAAEVLSSAAREGIQITLSPVFKTPEEVQKGSLLFLDMVDQAVILYDRDRFLRRYLDHLKARLEALGARRVYRRGGYYWLLKPDLKPGGGNHAVTVDELARAYVTKASKRRRVLEVLLEEEAYSDVVREAQKLVELALKGMLRCVGIDPPKWQ
jgi:uncharacterized protein